MNAIQNFKSDFRLFTTEDESLIGAKEAWFECAGQMNKRGLSIPNEWEYRPGGKDGTDPESIYYEIMENMTDIELEYVGRLLFRYCRFLEYLCDRNKYLMKPLILRKKSNNPFNSPGGYRFGGGFVDMKDE